jgi:hypothetical protein
VGIVREVQENLKNDLEGKKDSTKEFGLCISVKCRTHLN